MSEYAARRVMMVDNQVRPSDVTKYPVIGAMLAVPRERFVPEARQAAAYVGENIEIAPGRVLLEARTFAKLLDALNLTGTELVLDVGAGFGYSTAILARLAQMVIALEAPPLAAEAEARLAAEGVDNAVVVTGELTAGAAAHAPYDVIVIEGGVEDLPEALLSQLKIGGQVAALFMRGALGVVRIGTKTTDGIQWRDTFNAAAPVIPGFAAKRVFAL